MNWIFTILDRNNVAHLIDEPIGFSDCEIEIKRDLETHGIFFDYQKNDFSFDGTAMQLIRKEYDDYGVEGNMQLIIEWSCNNELVELYRGKLLFADYNYTCGDECFVKLPMETSSDILNLKNKKDQKVNLLTDKAFDGTTSLVPYNKLGFEMSLPSKAILLQNKSLNETLNITPVLGQYPGFVPSGASWAQGGFGMVDFGFTKTISSEIGNYFTNSQPRFNDLDIADSNGFVVSGISAFVKMYPPYCDTIYNLQPGTPNYGVATYPYKLDIQLAGTLKNLNCRSLGGCVFFIYKKNSAGILSEVYRQVVLDLPLTTNNDIPFNINYIDNNFPLDNGDQIFSFLSLTYLKYATAITNNLDAFQIECAANNYFKLTNLSVTEPTLSKVFMVNEAFSRITEAITNDAVRVYSDYFGRTDAQPYTSIQDGCGSLEVITKGLYLRRQENRIPNQPFTMNVSLQDMLEGLEPIHHIGIGFENDPNRVGYNLLRIENWKYFYKQTVVLSCVGVNKIDNEVIKSEHYSTFKIGYEKWEAEEYNGLDEFLTKRNFRTTLSQIKNELSKLSKFITSGYAIEITKRKFSADSKDWRYDNDTFLICCKRNNSNDIIVELGNILNPQNIIDPDTIYNYRISPIRNALRWMNKIFASYNNINPTNNIIFMDGDGNYFASGEMASSDCKFENQEVFESQNIDNSLYGDPNKAAPILKPERDTFQYPLSVKEFRELLSNPYGVIEYNNTCINSEGWIDTIKYKPSIGTATFKLIPKY
jgi:hypothetical protein